jgi:hypothetical protein
MKWEIILKTIKLINILFQCIKLWKDYGQRNRQQMLGYAHMVFCKVKSHQDTKQIFDFHDEGKKNGLTATAPLGINLKTNLPYACRCYMIPYIFGLSLLVLVSSTVYHVAVDTKYSISCCCGYQVQYIMFCFFTK